MNVHPEFTIPQMEEDIEEYDDLTFFPKVARINYNAYNCSVDSRFSERPGSKLGSIKNTIENTKDTKDSNENESKKHVTFNLKPEIFLIKSYKLYNRTGEHKDNCQCQIF